MSWPLSQDYNEAIQNPLTNFADPDLQRGEAATNALGIPMPYSGNFADVYQVRCPDGTRWAVKCFTREAVGLRERYQEISKHLRQVKLPFTVDFTYLERGICVLGRWYPVLKMHWVEGLTLNQFVSQHLDKPATLEALLHFWAKMARYLRAAGVGHCDLQHGNILLVPGANANMLSLKLIDYDGMWVPALAGNKPGEVGHPSYQHPQRIVEGTYSLDVDRFPVLLVATALRALKAGGRELWEKYDNGDNLLFTEPDLREPKQSALIQELLHLGDPETTTLFVPFLKSLYYGLASAPLLQELMTDPPRQIAPQPPAEREVPIAIAETPTPVASKAWYEDQPAPDIPSEYTAITDAKKRGLITTLQGVPVWARAAAVTALLTGCAIISLILIAIGSDSNPPNTQTAQGFSPQNQSAADTAPPGTKSGQSLSVPAAKDKVAEPIPKPEVDVFHRFEWGQFGSHATTTPDGKLLVVVGGSTGRAGWENGLWVWHISDGRLLFQTENGTIHPSCISCDPTGRYAAVGTDDGLIDIWDLKEFKKRDPFVGLTKSSSGVKVAFTPDGDELWSVDAGKSIRKWNWEKGQEVRRDARTDFISGLPTELVFAPNSLFYMLSNANDTCVRAVRPGQSLSSVGNMSGASTAYAIAPDNRHAIISYNRGAVVRNVLDANEREVIFDKHHGQVSAAAVSPDGRWALSAAAGDNMVRLWELDSGREIYQFAGHTIPPTYVAFLPKASFAISGGGDSTALLWRLPQAEAAPPATQMPPPSAAIPTAPQIPSLDKCITNSIGLKLVLIPAGKFTMGSSADEQGHKRDEGPQHEVEITQAFYMGVNTVTKAQFALFVMDDTYKTEAELAGDKQTWRNPGFAQTDNDPVVCVSWNDAGKFCEWLSKKEKKTYQLPTEAQWEYACRAGTTTVYSFGDDPKDLGENAWYSNNSGYHIHPVGGKKPNPWGLYDMHGNVWQWCADYYDEKYYSNCPKQDPQNTLQTVARVLRGGSRFDGAGGCRAAFRDGRVPWLRCDVYGFRVRVRLD